MSVPKFSDMYIPVLQLLSDKKPRKKDEMIDYAADYYKLSDDDKKVLLPSGKQTYLSNRVGWTIVYLKKAGLISSPVRASFVITDEGLKALSSGAVIDNEYLCRYESFRQFKNLPLSEFSDKTKADKTDIDGSTADISETPDEILESVTSQLKENLASELLDEIMKLTPTAFEHLVLDVMKAMGYGTDYEATSQSRDEGIDGVILEDKLGFDRIYVQAKLWERSRTVARPEIQAFVGAIAGRGGKGLFVTTARFTQGAVEYARGQHIILIDGMKLADCMIEYNFGVTVKRTYEVKAVDSDTFADYQEM